MAYYSSIIVYIGHGTTITNAFFLKIWTGGYLGDILTLVKISWGMVEFCDFSSGLVSFDSKRSHG